MTQGQRWYLYILETNDGRLYTGITTDIARRMKEHREGRGAHFTRVFGFKKLRYAKEYSSRSEAAKRESQIQRWPRKKKLAIIAGLPVSPRPP